MAALLPTPRASERENRQTRRTPSQEAGTHGLSLAAEVCELLPTPRATDTGTPGRRASQGFRPPLSQVVLPLLPTPRATAEGGSVRADGTPYGEGYGLALTEVVKLLPTPRASAGEKGGPNQRGSKGDLALPSAAHHTSGAATPPPSRGGKRSSDGPPPGQLTLWDA
ncbi:hypothetical protein V2S66_04460 [Streptomyces sp. V4-01]|uniref:Uncharacterized protein n=1 Tax=Actinacidiphila polyblastidii TaxID=3110430 RepID=A0ABU7P7A3_9ACTN|nr:hypothetical protein [Streptomyces sp. V4-01]